jgi:thiamine-monophosphate kinase
MNEFEIINKYLKPLSFKNPASFKLSDDIFYDNKRGVAVSVDTYVQGVHFISNEPKLFLKKVLRASLSDLYCKGINPKYYFLSFAVNKKQIKKPWLNDVKKILQSEQKKFNILLSGGDTTFSAKFVITITVLGYSKKKPVLRNGCKENDDIYVTGNIGDPYLGLKIIKKKNNFGKYNSFFKKKYHTPDLPYKISPYLNKIASGSIDVSDGLSQDLNHLCTTSNVGAFIDIGLIPTSNSCKKLINKKKIKLKEIFSNGDDYQILFTSSRNNRNKIKNLSKKLNLKITKIGITTKDKNIIFKDRGQNMTMSATKMGYTHTF